MASSGVTAIVSRTAKRSARPGRSAVTAGLIASAMFLAGCQSFPTVSTLGGLTGARDAKIAAARESDSLFGSYLAARHAGLDRDMDAAAAYYEQALKNDPSNLVILERSFLLEVSAGSVDKAMRLADRLVAERPNNRIARLALGLREMRAGRMEAARADFKEASGGLYNQLIVSLLNGWTYAGEGNSKAALGSLDQFSAVAASSAIPVFHKALILDQLGEGAEAEAAFAEVFERDGQDDFRVVETYGSFLERNGRLADARALYTAYLDVDPDNPVITARAEGLTGGS
ncbi:MAG: tetratricopeptide repeat protein, partial [Pseudomonadota bacterium]